MAHVSINSTDDLVWEVQDQVQRVERMVAALCAHHGIDPEQAARLPDDPGMRQPQPGASRAGAILPGTLHLPGGAPPGSTRAG